MNELLREMVVGAVSGILGSLLGSLGTIAAFRGSLIRIETRMDAWTQALGRVEKKADQADLDANRAWTSVRELRVLVKERTEDCPRYERDSGEQETVSG